MPKRDPHFPAFRQLPSTLALAIALAWPVAAQAQPRPGDEPVAISIAAQPLGDALNELAAATGTPIAFSQALVAGRTAPAVQGRLTPREAVERLLAGTGLGAASRGSTLVITAAPEPGATVLAPITVAAKAERATTTEGTGSFTTESSSAATGLNLSLRETPQSLTVVTRERIDQQSLSTLADVAEQVPGLIFVGNGTPVGGRSQLLSRGYMINSYQVDGVNVPWDAMSEENRYGHASLDTAIYDSITVVRGATGLLTGAGDPSGSIGLTRKRPTRAFQGALTGSVGSWDRRRAVADVGGPLNPSGNVRGRLVAAYDEGKTWVDRYSDDRKVLYGVVEVDLAPATLLTLSLEHTRANSKGTYWHEAYGPPLYFADGSTPIPSGRGTSMAPPWTYTHSRRSGLSADLEHSFSPDWSAKLSYGYSTYRIDSRRAMVFSVPLNAEPTDLRLLATEQRNTVHYANGKVDGKYRLFGREHELMAGFNLTYAEQRYPFSHYSNAGEGTAWWLDGQMHYTTPDWSSLGSDPSRIDTDQHGVYVATRLRPVERWSLILGGRLSYWKTHSVDLDPYAVTDDRSYSHEFTPYAGLVFDLTGNLSAYASYTEIFSPQSLKDVNGRLLDPEEGKNYEVGLKGEWFEGRLNASIAAFESRKDNLAVAIEDVYTPDGDQAYRAEDRTKGRGWELEMAGEVMSGWQLQGGYSRFRQTDSAGELLDTTRPIHQFKLFTSYRLPALPKLSVSGGVRWQNKTYSSGYVGAAHDARVIRDYAVFSLGAGYGVTEDLHLSLNVNNAFDRKYRINNATQTSGAPRSVMASLRYGF